MTQTHGYTPRSGVAEGLMASYDVSANAYDEFFSAPTELRPHVQPFVDSICDLGQAELLRRRQQAQRTLHENSVTYSAPDETERRNRPWEFDILPLLIPADQWRILSAGLAQRAHLLNLILQDIYGPQRLLSERLLPPELVFNNPGFSRALHDLPPSFSQQLIQLYAADLVRGPNGNWSVWSDRTEAPSGAAYALENRLVASSIYPQVFRSHRVERLAPFFMTLRETLQRMAYDHRDNPRVVLLSQGVSNPNFFEDAYLARYLGYSLVEGEDLTVRDGRVMLKTLGGLLPVDVLFRRLDDLDCDPLELRGDAFSGITGLVQALRSRTCAVANALGSGILESPALMAYLPTIARQWLGGDLTVPSVPTWWLGDGKSLAMVLDRPQDFWIRPAFVHSGLSRGQLGSMSKTQADRLLTAVKERPQQYVAHRVEERSRMPVFLGDTWQSWPTALRTYLVADGSSYSCMPGGLLRVSPEATTLDVSISTGDGAKDCWVLSDGPVRDVSLLPPSSAPIVLRRSGAELPSRVADNLFWTGRLAERAENSARLLRTLIGRLSGEGTSADSPDVHILMRCLAESGQIEPGYVLPEIRAQLPPIEQIVSATIFDEHERLSLKSNLAALNRTASLVRERLSLDSWRTISRIYREFQRRRAATTGDLADAQQQLNRLIGDLSALSGLAMESMTRTLGWRFFDTGRRLERSFQTLILARSLLREPTDRGNLPAELESILEVADSLITYRTRYLTRMQLPQVLDLLVTDETNPRSLAFQMNALSEHVDRMPRDRSVPLATPDQRLMITAMSQLLLISPEELARVQNLGGQSRIDRRLEFIGKVLPKLSAAIVNQYLLHTDDEQQLTETRRRGDGSGSSSLDVNAVRPVLDDVMEQGRTPMD